MEPTVPQDRVALSLMAVQVRVAPIPVQLMLEEPEVDEQLKGVRVLKVKKESTAPALVCTEGGASATGTSTQGPAAVLAFKQPLILILAEEASPELLDSKSKLIAADTFAFTFLRTPGR
jgi:hypothetical protein